MYYDFIQRHKRQLVYGGIGIIMLLIVWAVATYIDHLGKQPVFVATVPSDAKVMFEKQQKGNGTHWLPDGRYNVTVQKDGFETVTRDVIVSGSKQQNVVAVSLLPKSDDAKKWAKDHEDDYRKNEAYGGIEASSNGSYFHARNPITTKLPFTDPYFKISYVSNPDQSISLTIETPSPRYRFYAVEKIRQMGYDPTDFDIVFKDFHNPLEVKS